MASAQFGHLLVVVIENKATSSNQTVTPATVAAVAAVPAPAVTASATKTSATVTAVASVPAPNITVGPVPATVAAVAAVPAPAIAASGTPTPSTVAAVGAVPSPTILTGGNPSPATVAAIASVPAPARIITTLKQSEKRYPTSVSTRQVKDQYGYPIMFVGDSPWSIAGQLTNAEIDQYFANTFVKGINAVIVNLLEHLYSDHAPNNIDNVDPFTGTAFQSTPNSTYRARVDYILTVADAYGIMVLLEPAYAGFDSDDTQGWRTEIEAAWGASHSNITDYATTIIGWFGGYKNVIWLWGQDRTWNSFTTLKAAEKAMFDTIRAGSTQLHMFGGGVRGTTGASVWSGTNAITADIDSAYISNATPGASLASGYSGNTKPIGILEAYYEQEHSLGFGDVSLRNQLYGPICAGAAYVFFGNNPIWYLGSTAGAGFGTPSGTWQANLDQAGRTHLGYCAQLFAALGIEWSRMAPDTGGTFLTSGAGSGMTQAFAMYYARGGLVWKPTTGSITIDRTVFSAAIRIRWFDPTNATFTVVSASSPNTTTQTITHPGANSHGDNDWLLVVDLASPIIVADTVPAVAGVPGASITVSAGPGPATVAAVASVPAPTITASATKTSATVTAVAAVPAPVVQISATPATVAAVAVVPAPAITASATVTPSTVAAVAAVPAPVVQISATPATVTAIAAVPAAAVTASATKTSATVVAIAAVPAPTVIASATITPSTVTAVASVPAPAITATALLTPSTVAAVASVPSPTIVTPGLVTPATVAAIGAVPSPTILTGGNPTPATVAAIASVPAPTVLAVVVITPSTVVAAATVPAPALHSSPTVTPGTVTAIAAVPAPAAVTAGATITPGTVTAIATIPAPNLPGGTTVQPGTVTAVAAVPIAHIIASGLALIATVAAIARIPSPTIAGTIPPNIIGLFTLTSLSVSRTLRPVSTVQRTITPLEAP